MAKKLLFNNQSVDEVILECLPQGFNPDGSFDGNTKFTHTETYLEINTCMNKKIIASASCWARIIFYNSNKERIGSHDYSYATNTYIISEIAAKNTSAIYLRLSVNATVALSLQ